MAIKISKAVGMTHVGLVRSANQDSYLIDGLNQLYIVADGMGGHAGGEIASQLAITAINDFMVNQKDLSSESVDSICGIVAGAINHASAKIFEKALEDTKLRGMGTTVTLAKIINGKTYCGHVGDSRLYLIRNKLIYPITEDHSLVNEQVKAGLISKEEAEVHHLKNVITRSVGYQEEEDVDTTFFDINDDDILVICSDGLHGKIPDIEISTIVQQYKLDSVSKLIERALELGGEDNISVIVIAF